MEQSYEERLDELAERLMTQRFLEGVGAEAVNGMFIQDALLEAEDC